MARTISTLRDLEEFGISMLTGEADAWGARGLYLVTDRGRAVVLDVLGLPDTTPILPYDGSYSVAGQKVVGQVYIPHGLATGELAVIALISSGCHTVVVLKHGTTGFYDTDPQPEVDRYLDLHHGWGDVIRLYTPVTGQPRRGWKSVSAFTGTTV